MPDTKMLPDPTADDRQAELDEARMPFIEHLRELRVRLRNAVAALIVGFIVAYTFKDYILAFLIKPYFDAWTALQASNEALANVPPNLNYTDVTEPFLAPFYICIWAGVFISCPFSFHQLWQFIAPGLYKHERRYGVAFVATSAVLFVGGAVFCYYLVAPQVYDFLLGLTTQNLAEYSQSAGSDQVTKQVALNPIVTLHGFLAFERKLLLGFGLVFELPLLIFFLALVGAVTHRNLWRFNRWWIVLSFVLAAALTPPDVISQIMMAGPLIVLYNLSIGIAYFVTTRRERKQAALYADDEPDAPDAPDEPPA